MMTAVCRGDDFVRVDRFVPGRDDERHSRVVGTADRDVFDVGIVRDAAFGPVSGPRTPQAEVGHIDRLAAGWRTGGRMRLCHPVEPAGDRRFGTLEVIVEDANRPERHVRMAQRIDPG